MDDECSHSFRPQVRIPGHDLRRHAGAKRRGSAGALAVVSRHTVGWWWVVSKLRLCMVAGLIASSAALPPSNTGDLAALELDEDWLRAKPRLAMEINSRDGIDDPGTGVWHLGEARRAPVLLTRNLMNIWREPAILDRVRVKGGAFMSLRPGIGKRGESHLGMAWSGCRWTNDSLSMEVGSPISRWPGKPTCQRRSTPRRRSSVRSRRISAGSRWTPGRMEPFTARQAKLLSSNRYGNLRVSDAVESR